MKVLLAALVVVVVIGAAVYVSRASPQTSRPDACPTPFPGQLCAP